MESDQQVPHPLSYSDDDDFGVERIGLGPSVSEDDDLYDHEVMMNEAAIDFEFFNGEGFLQKMISRAVTTLKQDRALKLPRNIRRAATEKVRSASRNVIRRSRKARQSFTNRQKSVARGMKKPKFIQFIDKFAFTLGITVMCMTEFFLLRFPWYMHYWYTALVIPLMMYRFVQYHGSKYHYFMLDFCYFVQALMLLYLFVYPKNPYLFQLLYAFGHGPLLFSIVTWRNSLVFHDIDKLTSVFIHFMPALVCFCIRWFDVYGIFVTCTEESSCNMPFKFSVLVPTYVYCIWQLCYVIKTEVVDKEKLDNDKDLVTSLRWMTERRPHPIWKFVRKRWNVSGLFVLVSVQLLYTIVLLLPTSLIFTSFVFNGVYIVGLFVFCVWNGSCYYFDVFSRRYAQRLEEYLTEASKAEAVADADSRKIRTPSSDPKAAATSSSAPAPSASSASSSSSASASASASPSSSERGVDEAVDVDEITKATWSSASTDKSNGNQPNVAAQFGCRPVVTAAA